MSGLDFPDNLWHAIEELDCGYVHAVRDNRSVVGGVLGGQGRGIGDQEINAWKNCSPLHYSPREVPNVGTSRTSGVRLIKYLPFTLQP